MNSLFITFLLLSCICYTNAISGSTIAKLLNTQNLFNLGLDQTYFLPNMTDKLAYLQEHVSSRVTHDAVLISLVAGFPSLIRGRTNVTNLYLYLVGERIITWSDHVDGTFATCKINQCITENCHGDYYLTYTAASRLFKTKGYNVANDTERYNVVAWNWEYNIFRKIHSEDDGEYRIFVKIIGGGLWDYIDVEIGTNPRVSPWIPQYFINPNNCQLGDDLINLIIGS